jgi:hypothetical protein
MSSNVTALTPTISRFTPKRCSEVADEALEALQAVAKQFGLTVTSERGSYSGNEFKAKFAFAVPASDGSGASADFSWKAQSVGLPADCFGATFTNFRGETHRIMGINLRARKYPVQTVRVNDNKAYKMGAASVASHLDRAAQRSA